MLVVLRKKLYKVQINWQFNKIDNMLVVGGIRGAECVKLNNKTVIFISEQCLILKYNYVNLFKKFLFYIISGIVFGWTIQFTIVGYHYTLRFSAKKNI